MNIKQIFAVFLFATLVISCENKAEDIEVSELKTECEFADAFEIVLDEAIALQEAFDSEEGPSEAQEEEMASLVEKMGELDQRATDLKIEIKDCPNYKAVMKKGGKLDRLGVI
jgi:hypothetical protein